MLFRHVAILFVALLYTGTHGTMNYDNDCVFDQKAAEEEQDVPATDSRRMLTPANSTATSGTNYYYYRFNLCGYPYHGGVGTMCTPASNSFTLPSTKNTTTPEMKLDNGALSLYILFEFVRVSTSLTLQSILHTFTLPSSASMKQLGPHCRSVGSFLLPSIVYPGVQVLVVQTPGAPYVAVPCMYVQDPTHNPTPQIPAIMYLQTPTDTKLSDANLLLHQLYHAMGFRFEVFERHGLLAKVAYGVEGAGGMAYVVTDGGKETKFQDYIKDFFGCSDASFTGLRLQVKYAEDGKTLLPDSHWAATVVGSEIMSSATKLYSTHLQSFTNSHTLKALELTNAFKVRIPSYPSWGRKAGCTYVKGVCATASVTPTPTLSALKPYFCSVMDPKATGNCGRDISCFGKDLIGRCTSQNYSEDIPASLRFLGSAKKNEGGLAALDFCPVALKNISSCGFAPFAGSAPGYCFSASDNTALIVPTTDGTGTCEVGAVCAFSQLYVNGTYSILLSSGQQVYCGSGGQSVTIPTGSISGSIYCINVNSWD